MRNSGVVVPIWQTDPHPEHAAGARAINQEAIDLLCPGGSGRGQLEQTLETRRRYGQALQSGLGRGLRRSQDFASMRLTSSAMGFASLRQPTEHALALCVTRIRVEQDVRPVRLG